MAPAGPLIRLLSVMARDVGSRIQVVSRGVLQILRLLRRDAAGCKGKKEDQSCCFGSGSNRQGGKMEVASACCLVDRTAFVENLLVASRDASLFLDRASHKSTNDSASHWAGARTTRCPTTPAGFKLKIYRALELRFLSKKQPRRIASTMHGTHLTRGSDCGVCCRARVA